VDRTSLQEEQHNSEVYIHRYRLWNQWRR